ncbi:MAG TPA: hypothetical protein VK629_14380, partial [Steroidobacteraceae bacterium]|nr:hypothetical protein [Steroidobacteraceae bacterium]
RGYGITEALLGGLAFGAKGNTWMVFVGVTALASMTSSLRQALIVAVATTVSVIAIWYVAVAISGMLDAHGRFGADWIVERSLMLIIVATGAGVLWLQYTQRRARASWILILSATAIVALMLSVVSWSRAIAIQKVFAPEPGAANAVSVESLGGCFEASRIGNQSGLFSARTLGAETLRFLMERHLEPDGIVFATTLAQRAVPRDSKLVIDRVVGSYRRAGEPEESSVELARYTGKWTESAGMPIANYYWLLSNADYTRLAGMPDVEFRLDYYLTLLAPKSTIDLATDGRREFYPGIGYCSAKPVPASSDAEVDCLKIGAQPALLLAKPVGTSDVQGSASDFPNYVPTALDFIGGKRHRMRLSAVKGVARIQVTAYEAQAHFERTVTSVGLLGGPVTTCPAPAVN